MFRRSGPYYDLPPTLRTETYRLHLVLVDLAPADEAGRRQKEKPVIIEAEEFFAAQQEAGMDQAVPSGSAADDAESRHSRVRKAPARFQ